MRWSIVARSVAALINFLFLGCAISLLAVTLLSAFNAPKPVVSPEPVNRYPQYIITLLLIGCYAGSLLALSSLGIIALFFLNSFLLSLFVLGQAAMILVLMVAFAFTLTVRKRLHLKLEASWRGKPSCLDGGICQPVDQFLYSEMLLIIVLGVFLLLQVVQLAASSYLAERRSFHERYQQRLQKADQDDE